MLKQEILDYYNNEISDLDIQVMELSAEVAKEQKYRYVRARAYGFVIKNIQDSTKYLGSGKFIVEDGNNNEYSFYAYKAINMNGDVAKPGDFIFVPGAFIDIRGFLEFQPVKGFAKLSLPHLSRGNYPKNEFIDIKEYDFQKSLAKRFSIYREKESKDFNDYINSLALKDYYAEYDPEEDEKDKKIYESKKPQSIDSRQSKVYILSKSYPHKVLKETNAILANHKHTQFGMNAIEFRKKENIKIAELLKEINTDIKDVIFARKERSKIKVKVKDGDLEKEILLKARFAEIDYNTHIDVNPHVRFTKFGDIILKDNTWYLGVDDED